MITTVSPSLYIYKTRLMRVIDGDTIEAEIDLGFKMRWQTVVRFIGFDAYETRGTQAHPLGQEAKLYLMSLFDRFGNIFYLRTDRDEIAIYNRVAGAPYLETNTPNGLRTFVDVIASMRASGYDKSGAGKAATPQLVFQNFDDVTEIPLSE